MEKKQKVNPFEFDSEEEAIKALKAEGRRLKYIALKLWRKYLSEYKPVVYARTRDTQRGIKLGNVKKLDDDTLVIELTFVNDLMYHDSVVSSDHKQGHSLMLISEGWKTKKATGKKNPKNRYFPEGIHYFEGINFIGRLKEEFNRSRHKGITLEVQWNGEEFKKQKKQPNVLR